MSSERGDALPPSATITRPRAQTTSGAFMAGMIVFLLAATFVPATIYFLLNPENIDSWVDNISIRDENDGEIYSISVSNMTTDDDTYEFMDMTFYIYAENNFGEPAVGATATVTYSEYNYYSYSTEHSFTWYGTTDSVGRCWFRNRHLVTGSNPGSMYMNVNYNNDYNGYGDGYESLSIYTTETTAGFNRHY